MNTPKLIYIILSITCVALLLLNFNLHSRLEQSSQKELEWQYKYLVALSKYDLLQDEVLRLEDENQLLGSLLAEQEIINQ